MVLCADYAPYRTIENVIGGLVLIFTDINATKALEAKLLQENAKLKSLLKAWGLHEN